VTGPLLAAGGFGAAGVGAGLQVPYHWIAEVCWLIRNLGTVAAAAQSGIGNVAAGSAFAIFQSAGAGGAGLAIVNGAVQGVGVAIAAAGGIWTGKQVYKKSASKSEPASESEPTGKSESAGKSDPPSQNEPPSSKCESADRCESPSKNEPPASMTEKSEPPSEGEPAADPKNEFDESGLAFGSFYYQCGSNFMY
jgi:hypothetical protein